MSVVEEIKGLKDELHSAWAEYKAEHTAALEEAKGDATAIRAESVEALEKIDAKLDETIDEFNVRLQKLSDAPRASDERSLASVAYETFIRRGAKALSAEQAESLQLTDGEGNEVKGAMTISDDSDGGFLATDDVVDTVIKGVVEYSPIREVAFVRTTTRHSVKAPKRTQVAGAVWVGEVDSRTETQNPKYGKEEISTRELSAMADISRQDLEDVGVDLEQVIYGEFAEQFGVSEGAAFVSGDGVDGKPEGFLTAADTGYLGSAGIETVTSNTNDALNPDDFVDLLYALKDVYAKNATWVLKRSTTKAARKLKDQNDQYIWQPGLRTLAPATILDQPYVEAIDMPAIANGALAVAIADWKKAYWIVDRLQIETLRDPYTQAGNGYIRFWARKRVGGQVVLPEAIKLLEIQ